MKVVILAGGFGSRISEETHVIPKPMIEIGERPIIWHIMNIYSNAGFKDFIICAGYKSDHIKNYFLNYYSQSSDFTVNLKTGECTYHNINSKDWSVTVADTGLNTQTAGRLKRIRKFIGDDTDFLLTYGDGLSNISIQKSIEHHISCNALVTVSAVRPSGRFGALSLSDDGLVNRFDEKIEGLTKRVNGGFFVCRSEILDRIESDDAIFETDILPTLALEGKMAAFMHDGFWHPMDTLRDKNYLCALWDGGDAPWK